MYNFVDTTAGSASSSALPAEALQINGAYIENEIEGYRTLYVLGRELTETEITELQIGQMDGSEYRNSRIVSRSITVGYQLLTDSPEDFREKFNALNNILNQKEAKLIFADEPDKYFIGTKSEVGDVKEGQLNVTGEFVFYCCDPYKYATTEKSFQASANADGILEATIINNGTEEVPVSYNITHNHENGFLGIVSEYGAIQLGKVEELDSEIGQKSEILFRYDEPNEFINNFQGGEGIFDANQNYPKNGTWGQVIINVRKWLSMDQVGRGPTWHGAIMQKTLPADSSGDATGAKNFHCQALIWFETGKVAQTGAIEMVLGDSEGKHLASVHIVKSGTGNNIASVVFQINGKEKKRVKYEPTYKSATAKGGIVYIKKSGENFEFYFAGKKYPFREPSMKDKKATSLSLSVLQYGTRGKANLVSHMYFGDVYFQKDNVEYLKDIPNRYPEGSVVYIDGGTRKIYVDGIPSQQDEVKGTKYFKVPPGETKVQFYYSDFSDPPPTAEARIREAFL